VEFPPGSGWADGRHGPGRGAGDDRLGALGGRRSPLPDDVRAGGDIAGEGDAAAALEIHELPAARNCTYVVPACDFALALQAGAPFANGEMKVAAKLARRYFSWIGPATIDEFRQFSALGAKAAKAAIEPLQLEDAGEGRLLLPEDREAFEAFRTPREPCYRLASSLDAIALLRWDAQSLLDAKDLARPVLAGAAKGGGGLAHLPDHPIFDRGRVVGLWEYDPGAEAIAWTSFVPVNRELKTGVARMEAFVRQQLGDARAFSLDSPQSRAPKIAALHKAAGA